MFNPAAQTHVQLIYSLKVLIQSNWNIIWAAHVSALEQTHPGDEIQTRRRRPAPLSVVRQCLKEVYSLSERTK